MFFLDFSTYLKAVRLVIQRLGIQRKLIDTQSAKDFTRFYKILQDSRTFVCRFCLDKLSLDPQSLDHQYYGL